MSIGLALSKMLQASTDEELKQAAEELSKSQKILQAEVEAQGGTVTFGQTGKDLARGIKKLRGTSLRKGE